MTITEIALAVMPIPYTMTLVNHRTQHATTSLNLALHSYLQQDNRLSRQAAYVRGSNAEADAESKVNTFIADLAAYHIAPTMLMASPMLFQTLKRKSPNATAPIMVMITFFRFPAVLVIMGSLTRVQTKVEWLTVRPRIQLSVIETCITPLVHAPGTSSIKAHRRS